MEYDYNARELFFLFRIGDHDIEVKLEYKVLKLAEIPSMLEKFTDSCISSRVTLTDPDNEYEEKVIIFGYDWDLEINRFDPTESKNRYYFAIEKYHPALAFLRTILSNSELYKFEFEDLTMKKDERRNK